MLDCIADMIRHYCVLYSQGISIRAAKSSEKFAEDEETVQRSNRNDKIPDTYNTSMIQGSEELHKNRVRKKSYVA